MPDARKLPEPDFNDFPLILAGRVIQKKHAVISQPVEQQGQRRIARMALDETGWPVNHQHADPAIGQVIEGIPLKPGVFDRVIRQRRIRGHRAQSNAPASGC